MYKNGSLPLELDESIVTLLVEDAKKGLELEVDLPKQVVRRSTGEEYPFSVNDVSGWTRPFDQITQGWTADAGLSLVSTAPETLFD